MIFTWDWKNTCVVYKWWHVKTFTQFLFTLVAISVISAGYEFTKYRLAKWERDSTQAALTSGGRTFEWLKSIGYGFQVGYSFMLMLVFMTYNGWYMIATVIGATVGYHFWGQKIADARPLSCH